MILIPELQIVVILVPRTGSGSLRRAVAARYPQSMLIYRHMEADGVPQGYDRWQKVGVVRHPVHRLWSLYKFLSDFNSKTHDPAYTAAMRNSVRAPFSEWIVHNETVFTSPYDRGGRGRFYPDFTVRHPVPENQKSQFVYLRPDLGTKISHYTRVDQLYALLDVDPGRVNTTRSEPPPELSAEAQEHVARWFAWDLAACARFDDLDKADLVAGATARMQLNSDKFNPDNEGWQLRGLA